jgi:hypothetical protein
MKKNVLKVSGIIMLLSGMVLFNGCAPAYVPNTVNMPMLSNKGELQVAVNTGVSGFDPQASYAITDHIGVMLNGSFDNQVSDSTNNFHMHNFVEAAPGYYTKIGDYGRFEAFGGAGFGKTQGFYDNALWSDHADAHFMRFFIQPGIGFSTDFVDGGLSTRVVLVNLNQNDNSSNGLFFEPALTLKLGYRYVKLVSQVGLSICLNSEDLEFDAQWMLFSVGLQADLWRNY